MKITYLMDGLTQTGGSVVLYNFMDQLIARGHEVFVVTPDEFFRWSGGKRVELLSRKSEFGSASAWHRSLGSLKRSVMAAMKSPEKRFFYHYLPTYTEKIVRNFLEHQKETDVLVATYSLTAYPAFLLRCKAKKVFYHMQHYEELFFADEEYRRAAARATYSLPLNLIANSQWLKAIINRIWGRDCGLITPGIDTGLFKPHKSPEEKYTGLGDRDFTILSYVDEGRKFKGTGDLYAMMKTVWAGTGKRIKLKLFGPRCPDYFDTGDVEYLGFVKQTELPAVYSQVDLLVLTSWCESFPLQPLEAMACGTAVVTTRFGTEDYAIDNVNAAVVLPRDMKGMADRVRNLAGRPDELLRLSSAALGTAGSFSWERHGAMLEKLFVETETPRADLAANRADSLVESIFKGEGIEEVARMLDGKTEGGQKG